MISRVRGVIELSSSVTSRPRISDNLTGTGTPPATSTLAAYEGKPGSGTITSSPGSTRARTGKKSAGLAPGPITTSSGRTGIPRCSPATSAMAERRSATPAGAV